MTVCPACAGSHSRPSYLGCGAYRGFDYRYLACCRCGSLFVDPMPSETFLNEMYGRDYLDCHYSAELDGGVSHQEAGRELDRVVGMLAERRPGGTVLDVGCGAGRFLMAARSAGLRPEGFERLASTADAVSQATAARVHAGDVDALGGQYDAVHLADVLEHCARPEDLLRRLLRLLAPGGLLIARGPLENQLNLFQQAVRLSRLTRGCLRELPPTTMPPYHLILFTLAGWKALFDRCGMRVLHEEVYEWRWPAPEQFTLRPVSVMKGLSLMLSRSRLGQRRRMGNRVVSILAAEA
jgi:SAM-dependent methyltransferase